MIFFKKIRYKNFISTGNEWTEIQLNRASTTLIIGGNGAGKSTILDALSYALFGKAFRKINKPQLINSITNKNMLVEVEFSVGTKEFKIRRGMKPNIFEVFQNGVLINQSAEIKDYQSTLEKSIIRANHKSFCQVVVLGSATFQPFMQLPGGQRRLIIEDLLDLQIFTTMNMLLKEKLQKNGDAVIDSHNEKKIITEKLKLIKEHLLEIQNNNDQLVHEKQRLIQETSEQVEALTITFKDHKSQIDQLSDEIKDHGSLMKKINSLMSLKHKIEAKLAVINKDLDFFNNHDDCPTCKQPIDMKFKCDIVTSKNEEAGTINDGLEKLVEQYNEVQSKIDVINETQNKLNDIQMDYHLTKNNINSLLKYRESLEKEVENIEKKAAASDDHKLGELEAQLVHNKTNHEHLIDEKQILAVSSTLLKDGGIKAKIIKQYIPIINKLINKYLAAMEFMCQFELDEEFNETIRSRYRDEFSYESFSEGEKFRINLAILFTWRAIAKMRNSLNTNLLVLDEVFDSSLDANGTEEFLKIINNLTPDTNVFIISHKGDQIMDKFQEVIKFEKYKNFSKRLD